MMKWIICSRLFGEPFGTLLLTNKAKLSGSNASTMPVAQPREMRREAGRSLPGCQQCHQLFGTGGRVGPDITGSDRANLDYILQNIMDPNAVIPNDYRSSEVETKDGRVLTGVVREQTASSLRLATPTEEYVLPMDQVVSLEQTELSMMPEGLLTPFNDQEIRDLLYYLRQPAQSSSSGYP